MGYLASWDVSVPEGRTTIIDSLRFCSDDAYDAIDQDGCSQGACTWNKYDKDLRELSKGFPDDLIVLYIKGESDDTDQKNYYLNGKCQEEVAEVTYGEFDPNKLK